MSTLAITIPEAGTTDRFLNNPLPMWLLDPETLRILEVNDAAIRKYGYPRDEFTTLSLRDIRAREDAGTPEPFGRPRPRFGLFRRSQCHRTRSDALIWVDLYSRDYDCGGRWLRLDLVHDVTDLKRAYELLLEDDPKERYRAPRVPESLWRPASGTRDLHAAWK